MATSADTCLHNLLAALGDAAVALDARGNVAAANQAALELYAPLVSAKGQLQGAEFTSLFSKDVALLRQERLRHVLESGAAQCFVDEEGSKMFQHTLQPLEPNQGPGVLLISRDVSAQRKQDIELRREMQRQIFYLESLPGYVMLLRPDYSIVYVNRLFKQLFGRPGNRKCHEILESCQDICFLCPPLETLRDGQPRQWEWEHPDGRVFQAHARPMTDVDSQMVVMVLGMDVTAHKNAEAALQQVQEYQKAILDTIPDLVWLKDVTNTFVAVNKAYAQACQTTSENLLGHDHVQALGQELGARLQQRDQQVLDACERVTDEEELLAPDGESRWLEAVRVPIFDVQGKLLGLTGIARDVTDRKVTVDMLLYSQKEMERYVQERTARLRETVQQLKDEVEERKRTEEALEAARYKAEVATRAKSLFLANMSHEIRTPLNVIITMADMALRGQEALERARALEMVQEAGSTLLHVINDILDFSKIEARKLELEHVDFDLRRLLEGIWSIHSLQARNKGLATRMHIDMEAPSVVKGDPGRLRQALGNLLANAVKFTRQGRVELEVRLEPLHAADDPQQVVRLRFAVRDTGVGLPPDKQQLVFESFQQADNNTTREYGGTGLGLAIVKRLVELMQGEVGVESAPGKGSVFFFTAPLELGDAASLRTSARSALATELPELPAMRILLVEDNPLNLELVTAYLKGQGHEVLEAMDGLQALEILKSECVDLILMDIQMPMLDGVSATQTIRKASTLAVAPDVPVVALTAHALSGDRERFLAAGMDGYIAKPVDLTVLQCEIARVMAAKPAEPGKVKPAEPAQVKPAEPAQVKQEALQQPATDEPLGEPEGGLANRQQALALLQGNEKLLRRLDAHFLRDAPRDAAAIREALEQQENGAAGRIKEVAHSLKSQAATIGAERTAFLARNMEGAAAAQDMDSLPELLDSLEQEVRLVVRELEALPPA